MLSHVKFHGFTKGGGLLLLNLLTILLYCALILHNNLSNTSKKKFILNYSILLYIRKDGMYLYVFPLLSLSVNLLYLNRAPFSIQ